MTNGSTTYMQFQEFISPLISRMSSLLPSVSSRAPRDGRSSSAGSSAWSHCSSEGVWSFLKAAGGPKGL